MRKSPSKMLWKALSSLSTKRWAKLVQAAFEPQKCGKVDSLETEMFVEDSACLGTFCETDKWEVRKR